MKIGSKVVCIDDSIPPYNDIQEFHREFPNWIKKDNNYTIRDIFTNDGIVTSVVLEELRNPILYFKNTIGRSQEASFRINRFRELETIVQTETNHQSKVLKDIEEQFFKDI